jgi:hypothetical protein
MPVKKTKQKPKRPAPRIKKSKWYGFSHLAVRKKFSGGLRFLNEFCLEGNDLPYAVYSVKNPDRTKGHKDYLFLWKNPLTDRLFVSGLDSDAMEKHRLQPALHCLICNQVIFSMAHHHIQTCRCKNAWVDGGKSYFHCGFKKKSKTRMVTLDLLTDHIVKVEKT